MSKSQKISELKAELRTTQEKLAQEMNRTLMLSKEIDCYQSIINSTHRVIQWDIPDFSYYVSEYESNAFSFYDQIWTLTFGANDSDGYGFVLNMLPPFKFNEESVFVRLQFNLHHEFKNPIIKQRDQPLCFTETINTRGYYEFISYEDLRIYLFGSSSHKLHLSLSIQIVTESVYNN
jgi:hypothetical protein